MKAQEIISRAMGTVRILWAALTISTVLIAVVSFVVRPQVKEPPPAFFPYVFGALAAALAVLSIVFPAKVLAQNAKRMRPEIVASEPVPGGATPPAKFAHPAKAARQALALSQSAFILGMALSEAISLFGLVLHMQGEPVAVSTPFFVVGTLLAAVRFPTAARLLGPYERIHGATFAASDGASY